MTSRDFVYWIQGFIEVADPKTIDEKQLEMIKKHLNLVFVHEIDPSYTDDPKKQEQMNAIHSGLPFTQYKPDNGEAIFRC